MENRRGRLARGDPAAFAELYDVCAVRVHHYLTVRLGAQADADDVLQETFVRLARDRQKLAAVQNLVGYVFATARNEATRLIERRVRDGRRRMEFSSLALVTEGKDTDQQDRENAGALRRCWNGSTFHFARSWSSRSSRR